MAACRRPGLLSQLDELGKRVGVGEEDAGDAEPRHLRLEVLERVMEAEEAGQVAWGGIEEDEVAEVERGAGWKGEEEGAGREVKDVHSGKGKVSVGVGFDVERIRLWSFVFPEVEVVIHAVDEVAVA